MVLFLTLLLLIVPPAAPVSTQENGVRYDIVQYSKEYLGQKYRYGGTGSGGFDCSGFTSHVYARFGYRLPRSARDQYTKAKKIPSYKARPGDLVFFRINGVTVSHVGIYLGGDRFIHSPSTGRKIGYASLKLGYWKKRFAGFGSYIP